VRAALAQFDRFEFRIYDLDYRFPNSTGNTYFWKDSDARFAVPVPLATHNQKITRAGHMHSTPPASIN
jgi:hypothetical protein